uniref:F-box domain-containing protein n=1 Tax=Arundo donax TaxID=35708 RepID=A0A0A9G8C9_ARUDO
MEDDEKSHLPLDIMSKIPTHISDPASLARAASPYKLWRYLIKDSTFLDSLKAHHSDHDFTSSLLLGFFYQESSEAPSHLWQHHEDKNRCLAPSFIPTSELLKFSGSKEGCNAVSPMSLGTFIQGVGASLNFYEPIASQDSFLALRHGSEDTDVPGRMCYAFVILSLVKCFTSLTAPLGLAFHRRCRPQRAHVPILPSGHHLDQREEVHLCVLLLKDQTHKCP